MTTPQPPQRDYRPGDTANGYILGEDNRWYPQNPYKHTEARNGKLVGTAIGVVIAFLLIPVIVVVAAVAIPIFLGQKAKAENAKLETTLKKAQTTLTQARQADATATQVLPDTIVFTGTSGMNTFTLPVGENMAVYRSSETLTPYTVGDEVGTRWCVSITDENRPGVSYHLTGTGTQPEEGTCATAAAGSDNQPPPRR